MAGSGARRWRSESPELQPTTELRETGTTGASFPTDTPVSTTALQPQQSPDRSKKRRLRIKFTAAKERCEKKEKMAWVDEWIRRGEEEEETDQAKMKDDVVEEEKTEDDVAEEDEVVSSAPSSPIRAPKKSGRYRYSRDLAAYEEAFQRVAARYKEKIARQMKLPTLDQYKPRTSHGKDIKPLSIGEPERKTVLRAARSVVGVSSSVGGEPLKRCSGFWIDWDEDKKTGIVLTTVDIVFRDRRSCFLESKYAHDAEVIVHMPDDTTAEAHLLYYQKHYNLALFRVRVDKPVHVPSFNGEVQCAQEIFELGRDEHSYLRIGHGRVKYSDRTFFDGYHYMHILGGHEGFEYRKGGPVIDIEGNVVGMITQHGSFMLSSILLKCLRIWRKFRCIPRPHLGLKFCSMRLLDLAIVEKIAVKCNVDEGLIVKEVSNGSHAEKLGIRVGDVIECFSGERICNTFELENILLSTCEGHLERGNGHNSKVDIVVVVFHTCKGVRSTKTLAIDLSERKEKIQRVYYPFTIGEGVSASTSLDQEDSD